MLEHQLFWAWYCLRKKCQQVSFESRAAGRMHLQEAIEGLLRLRKLVRHYAMFVNKTRWQFSLACYSIAAIVSNESRMLCTLFGAQHLPRQDSYILTAAHCISQSLFRTWRDDLVRGGFRRTGERNADWQCDLARMNTSALLSRAIILTRAHHLG